MDEMLVLQLLSALGVLLFSVGTVLSFWLMRRPWTRAKRFVGQGRTTRGVVVGHVGGGFTESGETMYSPEIEFVDRTGRTFRITSSMSSTHPSPIGTPVDVAYDVNDPRKGVVLGAARILALVGSGMAALFGLCAAGSAIAFVALSV